MWNIHIFNKAPDNFNNWNIKMEHIKVSGIRLGTYQIFREMIFWFSGNRNHYKGKAGNIQPKIKGMTFDWKKI